MPSINTPPVCIAVLSVPRSSQEREIIQYASHLYRNTPPMCIAMLLGKFWSPECSPKGGGKLRGGENIPQNYSPKTVLDHPTCDTFPPPICSHHVIFFGGNGHRADKFHFLRPPKVVLEGALYSTFPPPPKSPDTFCPPPFATSFFCRFWPFPKKRSIWKTQIFAKKKKTDFRRKPQKNAGTRRKPQIGVCPLWFVPLSAALFWSRGGLTRWSQTMVSERADPSLLKGSREA